MLFLFFHHHAKSFLHDLCPISASVATSSSSWLRCSSKRTFVVPRMKSKTKEPAFQWCCVASVDPTTSSSSSSNGNNGTSRDMMIHVERINGYDDDDDTKMTYNNKSYYDDCTTSRTTSHSTSSNMPLSSIMNNDLDITSSSDWMEYIELLENRTHQSGGAGAYDTFRCDLVLSSSSSSQTINPWRIWGQDFHLKRLQESYRSILAPTQQHYDNENKELDKMMETALHLSKRMVTRLLKEAETASILHQDSSNISAWEDVPIQLVRVTLLWSPPRIISESDSQQQDDNFIIVRGHACSSARPFGVHQPVQPIIASVAAKQAVDHKHVDIDDSMPSRLRDPQHKIASWTRLRKQMERPETYKPPGVSEVLLVRPTSSDDCTEILEGLSSNLFVIYADGRLRTASDGVLYGYVRHLVLECAESCGLRLDPRPILLQDAEKGLWKEAFITSSSRLIYPISKLLVHTDQKESFVEYWSDPVLVNNAPGTDPKAVQHFKPKWQQILDKILEKPYPRIC